MSDDFADRAEYVAITARSIVAGAETAADLARREELAAGWPLDLLDDLDELARRRAYTATVPTPKEST